MNYSLTSQFGRMCPDFVHPVLAAAAAAAAMGAEQSPGPKNPSASYADATDFVAAFYESIEAPISLRSFPHLGSSGLMERGHFLTLNGLAYHSGDSAYSASSLGAILESNVPLKYYLFATACSGILRRAAKRGRAIPVFLLGMLQTVAATWPASYKEAVKLGWAKE